MIFSVASHLVISILDTLTAVDAPESIYFAWLYFISDLKLLAFEVRGYYDKIENFFKTNLQADN